MRQKRPFISFTSDFGIQTQGIAIMEGVALSISPDAHVIHLAHGLPSFNIICAARIMETAKFLPVGFHVCVVDPGVGTARKPLIIKTKRGDCLIGPDNGVLIPVAHMLGGCEKIVEISNPKYMLHPVSPVFHGRDIFAPAAAHLSLGKPIEKFGRELKFENLTKAPYEEAAIKNGSIEAKVIHINKYGSLHLNILRDLWNKFNVKKFRKIILKFGKKTVEMPFVETFGDIGANLPLILKDDYGRVEVAINVGDFAKKHKIKIGDTCLIKKHP